MQHQGNSYCEHIAEFLADPEMGVVQNSDGTYTISDPYVLLACPMCGQQIPNLWSKYISDGERERLWHLAQSVHTPEEAIEKLGPPDYDAMMQHFDGNGFNEELSNRTRNIEYYNFSDVANIEFYFDVDGRHFFYVVIKDVVFDA